MKQWLIQGSQEITVTAQALWRVTTLPIKEGQKVWPGQLIVWLSDSLANYRSQVQRAQIALETASINLQNSKINLDKQWADLQLALDRSKNDFTTIQQTTNQQLKKAAQDLKNAAYDQDGTPSNLTLKNSQLSILNSLDSLNQTYAVQRNSAIQNIDTIVQQTDVLLWISDRYKNLNDNYEIYLWAKSLQEKYTAEQQLSTMYQLLETIKKLPLKADNPQQLQEFSLSLENTYTAAVVMIDQMILVLRNSIDSWSPSFNQPAINGFIATFQWLKTASQWNYAWFTAYQNSVNALINNQSWYDIGSSAQLQLNTILTNLKVAKENAEIAYNNALISSKDSLFKAEQGVKIATSNLENFKRTNANQIELLQAQKNQAQVAYQDAVNQYNKLSVKAPIAGTIGSVLVDVGQEVANGTPLFTISSTSNQQIEVFLSVDELTYTYPGISVIIRDQEKIMSGRIASISSVADSNLNYKAIVSLNRPVSLLWSSVEIYIPITTKYPLIPVNAVSPNSLWMWEVSVLVGTGVQSKTIALGKIRGEQIEVLSWLYFASQVIISPVLNYDPATYTIIPIMTK